MFSASAKEFSSTNSRGAWEPVRLRFSAVAVRRKIHLITHPHVIEQSLVDRATSDKRGLTDSFVLGLLDSSLLDGQQSGDNRQGSLVNAHHCGIPFVGTHIQGTQMIGAIAGDIIG